MISEIIDKAIIQGQALSSEERNLLLEFFAKAESADMDVNRDVTASMSALFPRLSDISAVMGTVIAGEFRSGNFKTPGDGFTGGRFGYPGFEYSGTTYFLAGVENDVLQVGLSLADGTIKAGAGDVTIDGDGIWITNQQAAFGFEDTGGNRFNLYIYSDSNDAIGIINNIAGKAIRLSIKLTDTTTPYMKWYEDPSNANVSLLQINASNSTPAQVAIGGSGQGASNGILLSANKDGLETVFNDTSYDVDFRVEGATNPYVFMVDGGNNRVEIGRDDSGKTIVHIINPAGTTYFNEPNYDIDFVVEGSTDESLFYVDAGLDAIGMGGAAESGYKLKVHGKTNLTSGNTYDINGTPHTHTNQTTEEIQDIVGTMFVDGGHIAAVITYNDALGTIAIDAAPNTIGATPNDGWISKASDTWTRTGNHTFTISGIDRTATYRKGTKVRYKDGASFEYGVIYSSSFAASTTTVTLVTNTDYAMAAATITDKYISYIENPEGFPHYLNWDANPQGFSAVPTSQTYRWHTKSTTIFCEYIELGNGTSNATTFTATGPCSPAQGVATVAGTLVDNGAIRTVAGRVTMSAGSTAIAFRTDMATGAWANANGKRAVSYWSYEY